VKNPEKWSELIYLKSISQKLLITIDVALLGKTAVGGWERCRPNRWTSSKNELGGPKVAKAVYYAWLNSMSDGSNSGSAQASIWKIYGWMAAVQAVQRYLQLIHIPIMIDVIFGILPRQCDFFHLRCWQYISQYFYPIVEASFALVLETSKSKPNISNIGFCLRYTRHRHIPCFDDISGLRPPPMAIRRTLFFSIFACFSKCFVRLNLLMLKKCSYSMPINRFAS